MTLASAWWSTGHQLLARVAFDDLAESGNEETISRVTDLLRPLMHLTNESQHPFVEAAVWADDIKTWMDTFDHWHFVDTPYVRQDNSKVNIIIDPYNATYAIPECIITLKRKKTAYNDPLLAKSIDLRFLMHIVGDIHQPLHSVAQYSNAYPNGDLGGNLVNIEYESKGIGKIWNLHALWDACVD